MNCKNSIRLQKLEELEEKFKFISHRSEMLSGERGSGLCILCKLGPLHSFMEPLLSCKLCISGTVVGITSGLLSLGVIVSIVTYYALLIPCYLAGLSITEELGCVSATLVHTECHSSLSGQLYSAADAMRWWINSDCILSCPQQAALESFFLWPLLV